MDTPILIMVTYDGQLWFLMSRGQQQTNLNNMCDVWKQRKTNKPAVEANPDRRCKSDPKSEDQGRRIRGPWRWESPMHSQTIIVSVTPMKSLPHPRAGAPTSAEQTASSAALSLASQHLPATTVVEPNLTRFNQMILWHSELPSFHGLGNSSTEQWWRKWTEPNPMRSL